MEETPDGVSLMRERFALEAVTGRCRPAPDYVGWHFCLTDTGKVIRQIIRDDYP